MRIVLLYFILSGLIHTTTAQQNVRYDTSVLHVRGFSSKSLSEYEHNREFQYSSVREPPHSLWDRFVEWMNYWESRLFMSLGQGKFISWLATLIAIAVIVFFIVRVSGMGDGSLFKKKSPQGLPYTVGYEDIHAIDFGEAIRLAIEQRNFR